MIPKKAISTRFRLLRSCRTLRAAAPGVTSPSSLSLAKCGLSASLARIHTEMASSTAETRNGTRQPQAANASSPIAAARRDDHQQRGKQAERSGRLDPAGRGAAPVVGRMLGDVDRGAAIFAAQRNALEDAQDDQQDRPERARLRIGRKEADQEGRRAHQADGDEERALAAEPVADHAEDQARRAAGRRSRRRTARARRSAPASDRARRRRPWR